MAVIFETHKAFEEAAHALLGDWLPIDYSQADFGKGFFSSEKFLLEMVFAGGCFYIVGNWNTDVNGWYSALDVFKPNQIKRARPIPQGWVKGGKQ